MSSWTSHPRQRGPVPGKRQREELKRGRDPINIIEWNYVERYRLLREEQQRPRFQWWERDLDRDEPRSRPYRQEEGERSRSQTQRQDRERERSHSRSRRSERQRTRSPLPRRSRSPERRRSRSRDKRSGRHEERSQYSPRRSRDDHRSPRRDTSRRSPPSFPSDECYRPSDKSNRRRSPPSFPKHDLYPIGDRSSKRRSPSPRRRERGSRSAIREQSQARARSPTRERSASRTRQRSRRLPHEGTAKCASPKPPETVIPLRKSTPFKQAAVSTQTPAPEEMNGETRTNNNCPQTEVDQQAYEADVSLDPVFGVATNLLDDFVLDVTDFDLGTLPSWLTAPNGDEVPLNKELDRQENHEAYYQEPEDLEQYLDLGGASKSVPILSTSTAQSGLVNNSTADGLGLGKSSDHLRVSKEDEDTIRKALRDDSDDDEYVVQLRYLIQVLDDKAKQENRSTRDISIQIPGGQALHLVDILCLYYERSLEGVAWFLDSIINTLCELGSLHCPDVHFDGKMAFMFTDGFLSGLDDMITNAQLGMRPSLGWPFEQLTVDQDRILMTINITGFHWVTVEVMLRPGNGRAPRVICYNSLVEQRGIDPTLEALTNCMGKMLCLSSLNPGSPLAGLDFNNLVIEEPDCPQQEGGWDCGPMSLYIFARRLHNKPINSQLNTASQRSLFGHWCRKRCVDFIYRSYTDPNNSETLDKTFANESLPSDTNTDADLVDVVAAEPICRTRVIGAAPEQAQLPSDDDLTFLWREPKACDSDYQGQWIIELGAQVASFASLIVVMRWSGAPSKYHNIRDPLAKSKAEQLMRLHIKSIVTAHLMAYHQACGYGGSDVHAIVHASVNLPTRHMPATSDARVGEKDPKEKANLELDKVVVLSCPICTYSRDVRSLRQFSVTKSNLKKHLGGHMPRYAFPIFDGEKWAVSCAAEGCKYTNRTNTKQNAIMNLTNHTGAMHGAAWLQEQGLELSLVCTCEAPGCSKTWKDESELQQHIKNTLSRRVSTSSPLEHEDRAQNSASVLHLKRRAVQWTQSITASLRKTRATTAKPVLLSIGVDGFSCNTILLAQWLGSIDFEFYFVIVAKEGPDELFEHFVPVPGADGRAKYVGLIDSTLLRSSLAERQRAPQMMKILLDHWDRQQANKDEKSIIHARRNIS